jgi:hypothetical protein
MIPAFISYSHNDRRLAGLIKGSLDYYGFDSFGVVKAFGGSGSFREAAREAARLSSLEPFSDEQVNEIVRVSCQNDQIWHGFDARQYVNDLIRRESARIDKKLVWEFAELQK